MGAARAAWKACCVTRSIVPRFGLKGSSNLSALPAVLVQMVQHAHRDAREILESKPAKPLSLWIQFLEDQRQDIIDKNSGTIKQKEIMRVAQERFNSLTPSELADLEADHEDRIQDYRRRLHEWHRDVSPEESLALLRHDIDAKKELEAKKKKRKENRRLKEVNEIRLAAAKEEGKPIQPGGVFLGVFVPTLTRGENVPYNTFINDAATKWKNMNDEEKQKYRDIHSANIEDYRRQMDTWVAEKKEEERAMKRKARRKGTRNRGNEEEEEGGVERQKLGSLRLDGKTKPSVSRTISSPPSKALSTTNKDNVNDEVVSRPLRPRNAFFVFKDSVEKVADMPYKELLKFLAKKWSRMTEEKKNLSRRPRGRITRLTWRRWKNGQQRKKINLWFLSRTGVLTGNRKM